jgi:Flp pilus assembly protein TadG
MIRRAKPRGQAMVEFALVFPIFILLLVGLFDFGRVIWVNDTLASAAREAGRFAIVHGGSSSSLCPMGPAAPTAIVPPLDTTACPVYSPSRQAIKDVAMSWASGTSSDITVSVCYGAVTSCSGDTDEPNADNRRGTQVMVTVTSYVRLSVPSLLGFPGINETATSTMLVNH